MLGIAACALIGATAAPARAGSADVAALQVAMGALGLYPHPVDGVTGPWTVEAVRSFQASHGLTADGVAGPETLRALGRRGKPSLGSRPMRIGQRGFDVAALQFLLNSRGFGPGSFDGGFGPNTAAAVRRFQAAAGLAVDDVAGSATLNALKGGQPVTLPSDSVRFLRPLSAPITDGFGWIPPGRTHTGIDFPASAGATVGAAGRGTVAFAGWNSGGYGYLVVVRHRLGYESWYAHLSTVIGLTGRLRGRRHPDRRRRIHWALDRAAPAFRGPPPRHPDRPGPEAALGQRRSVAARPGAVAPRSRQEKPLPPECRHAPHPEHRPAGRPLESLPLAG